MTIQTALTLPPRWGQYDWSTGLKLPERGQGAVSFVARTTHDVAIALSPEPATVAPMYEIFIGGWGNTKTVIRRAAQGEIMAELGEGLVAPGAENALWIAIDKNTGLVQVGRGEVVGENVALTFHDPNFLGTALYVGFSSWDVPVAISKIVTMSTQTALALSPRWGQYEWSTALKLPAPGQGAVSFVARTTHDVAVAISPEPATVAPMYEIFIGGWGNTRTVMRRSAQGEIIAEVAGGVVPGEDDRLWIAIDKYSGYLRLGRGKVGENVLLSHYDPRFLETAQYVSFTSWDVPVDYSHISTTAEPALDSQLDAVIKKFAPILYFHPNESYLMSSVEWFLAQATLYVGGVAQSTPQDGLANHLPSDPNLDPNTVWLDAPNSARGGNLATAEALIRVKHLPGNAFTDLQFWFFYPYNGAGTAKAFPVDDSISLDPLGEHGGDWEHITLRIENRDLSLHSVYLSQHSGGVWLMNPSQELEWVNGRMVIYASRNGHAAYAHAGNNLSNSKKYWEIAEFGLRNDTARGPSLDCAAHYRIISTDYLPASQYPEPAWLSYRGRWGAVRQYVKPHLGFSEPLASLADDVLDSLPEEVKGESGPTGPNQKGSWKSVLGGGDDERVATSRLGYLRLRQRPWLAAAADPTGTGVSLVSFNPNDPAQRWVITDFRTCSSIRSVSRNLLLSAPNNNGHLVLVDLSHKDNSALWTQGGDAWRPVRDEDQNLNVLGEARPGPMGVWTWSGGDANETWRFDPVGIRWMQDPTPMVVRLTQRPGLVLTSAPSVGHPQLMPYGGPETRSQVWLVHDLGGGLALLNQESGMALAAPNANTYVREVPATALDNNSVWTRTSRALRPARDDDQNLNVAGNGSDPVPGSVITYGWSGGDANECWSLTPVWDSPALPSSTGYLRLAKKGQYGLSIVNGQAKLVPANNNDPAQRWVQIEFPNWGYQYVHAQTGLALAAPNNKSNVTLVDRAGPNGSSIWTKGGQALRPYRDDDQNLNVAGSDNNPSPGSNICVWTWGGGNANETWVFVTA
ncbi:MAG: Vps62-related protein [Nannocystaceae bacterium]